MEHLHQTVTLTRDVPAIIVPDGHSILLLEGDRVTINQFLGGTFTAISETSYYMIRIGSEHADALGVELPEDQKPPTPEELAAMPRDRDSVEVSIWEALRSCYDPEIPVNIVELGLIYDCEIDSIDDDLHNVEIKMTLTAPGCGMGPILQGDVEMRVSAIPGVDTVDVEVVFDPPWSQDMLSEAARLELGLW